MKEEYKCSYNHCMNKPMWGGSAMSEGKCENCGKQVFSGDTNVDKYCEKCATKLNLCKYCGNEIGKSYTAFSQIATRMRKEIK